MGYVNYQKIFHRFIFIFGHLPHVFWDKIIYFSPRKYMSMNIPAHYMSFQYLLLELSNYFIYRTIYIFFN